MKVTRELFLKNKLNTRSKECKRGLTEKEQNGKKWAKMGLKICFRNELQQDQNGLKMDPKNTFLKENKLNLTQHALDKMN